MINPVYSHVQILKSCGVSLEPLDVEIGRALSRGMTPPVSEAAAVLLSLLSVCQRTGLIRIPCHDGVETKLKSVIEALPKEIVPYPNRLNPSSAGISMQELADSGLIRTGPQEAGQRSILLHDRPLVFDRGHLYFRRYWSYEFDIAHMIQSRIGPSPDVGAPAASSSFSDLHPDQVRAVESGLQHAFLIITGGPGTGKTHTVLTLMEAFFAEKPDLRIALCAPTGKAAARMMESISVSLSRKADDSDLVHRLPEKASTVHRLLGWNPSSGKSRFNRNRPLPYDLVIVDEASMIDMAMMARLSRALSPTARLILLGDKDQLSSVEAGAVFGDIASAPFRAAGSSEDNSVGGRGHGDDSGTSGAGADGEGNGTNASGSADQNSGSAHPLAKQVVRLSHSWRFSEESLVGRLATRINEGDAEASWSVLSEAGLAVSGSVSGLYARLLQRVREQHQRLLDCENDADALRVASEFQILTALRVGPFGALSVNAHLDRAIAADQLAAGRQVTGSWYEGRVVMITANLYDLGLFNGDIGVVRERGGRLMVAFPGSVGGSVASEGGEVRWVSPTQLAAVESAWAITVHKSQGSEYDDVFLVLPETISPVLSRELVYTALTRSRGGFNVRTSKEVWMASVRRQVERYSGVSERIG